MPIHHTVVIDEMHFNRLFFFPVDLGVGRGQWDHRSQVYKLLNVLGELDFCTWQSLPQFRGLSPDAFEKFLKIILRVCVLSLCVCSCTTCVQKRAFWNSSYRGWWAAIWVLRNKPGSPARAASALNGWAISLALPSPHPATFWNQWPWHYTGITNWRSSKLSYRSSISIYPPLPTVPFLQAHLLELWQSVKPEEEIPPSFPTTTQIWPYCKTVSSLCVHIHDQYFSPISCFFSHYRIAMSKHSRSLPLQWLPCT